MPDEIIWEEPPPAAQPPGRSTAYSLLAQALRERPGQWARVPGDDRSPAGAKQTAMNLRRGKMRGFEEKDCFEIRTQENRIWVRYVPKGPQAPPPAEDAAARPQRTQAHDQLSKRIKAWAQANDYPDLSSHGRLPRHIIEAFQAAHPHLVDGEADELLDEADSDG